RPDTTLGDPSRLEPGSMISVMLVSGDMSIGADGTLTHIDGNSVYAFGHRFLSVGATELPFARAEVLALAPNLSTSFKISAAREFMGAITGDFSTAVTGQLGRRAATVPVGLKVKGRSDSTYDLELVRDRYLTPFLLQMAVYSALDATERTIGSATVSLKGTMEFRGAPSIRLDDSYAGDGNIPMQVSLATAIPLAYVLQGGFDDLELRRISLEIGVSTVKRQLQIEDVWPDRQRVRPGEEIELGVLLAGENGAELIRKVRYTVPRGAPDGALHFTVADATTTNTAEYGYLVGAKPRTATQVVTFLNELRRNTGAYVRVWRPNPGYRAGGRNLPSPPASVALILRRDSTALGGTSISHRSKFAELSIDAGGAVITGSKTIQVEVKQ
ncbi:MAG: hypothetical protein GY953_43250, partial [bacterium]|nr:hypothetical protein [bacterium]